MAANISQKDHWTGERIDLMKALYVTGISASLIAAEINAITKTSFTRNAIIGKIHREGLERRGRNYNRAPKSTKTKKRPPRPRVNVYSERWGAINTDVKPPRDLDEIRLADVIPRHISLMDLQCNECRYPYGDSNYTFCGHATHGESYCAPHAALTRKEINGKFGIERPVSSAWSRKFFAGSTSDALNRLNLLDEPA